MTGCSHSLARVGHPCPFCKEPITDASQIGELPALNDAWVCSHAPAEPGKWCPWCGELMPGDSSSWDEVA